jgi:hypothetical protein
MSLISHLVEAAGTPEKQQKLRDGDMCLSVCLSLSYMRKTTTNGCFFPLHEKTNKCSRKATASSPRENTKGLQANPSSTTHVTTLHKLSLSLSNETQSSV